MVPMTRINDLPTISSAFFFYLDIPLPTLARCTTDVAPRQSNLLFLAACHGLSFFNGAWSSHGGIQFHGYTPPLQKSYHAMNVFWKLHCSLLLYLRPFATRELGRYVEHIKNLLRYWSIKSTVGITENRNDTRWWVVTGRRNHRHGRPMDGARA